MRIAVLLVVATAQEPRLTLQRAIELARAASPELASARSAARASAAFARQAGAFANPSVVLGRERTSGPDGVNGQVTIHLEQRLEVTGVRAADRTAARARASAAAAETVRAEQLLDAQVTKSFVRLVAARRRTALADRLRQLTDSAAAMASRRFDAGDVSGFDRRRLELEGARYHAAAIASRFAADSTATGLAAVVGYAGNEPSELAVVDSFPAAGEIGSLDSLISRLPHRSDLQASEFLANAAQAEVVSRSRQWIPTPTVSAGYKQEETAGQLSRSSGFVAGVALPLPLWDRRASATAGQAALAERARAEYHRLRRDAATEVRRLASGLRSLVEQRRLFGRRLGPEADLALRSVAVAFAEGELTVAQWLDAVRAYYEAQGALLDLDAEIASRWADLIAATGVAP